MSLKLGAHDGGTLAVTDAAVSGTMTAPPRSISPTRRGTTDPRFEQIGRTPLTDDTSGRPPSVASFRVSTRSPLHVVVQGPSAPHGTLERLQACLRPGAATVRLPPGALHGDAFRLHDVSYDAADYARAEELASEALLDISPVPDDRHIDKLALFATDVDKTLIDGDFHAKLVELKGDPEADALAWREDIVESMRGRVATLAGIGMEDFHEVGDMMARRLMPGAREFIGMLSPQARVLLISSGFTQFVEKLRDELGAKHLHVHAHANRLLTTLAEAQTSIDEERFDDPALSLSSEASRVMSELLTGKLDGEFLDGNVKERLFRQYHAELPDDAHSAAMGDGENDIPMLAAAVELGGVGAAFRPRYGRHLLPSGVDVIEHSGYDALGNLFMGIEHRRRDTGQ